MEDDDEAAPTTADDAAASTSPTTPRPFSKWKFVKKTLQQRGGADKYGGGVCPDSPSSYGCGGGRRRKSCFAFFPSLAIIRRRRSKWTILRIVFRFLGRWKRPPLGRVFYTIDSLFNTDFVVSLSNRIKCREVL
jgi:hypothetical protein